MYGEQSIFLDTIAKFIQVITLSKLKLMLFTDSFKNHAAELKLKLVKQTVLAKSSKHVKQTLKSRSTDLRNRFPNSRLKCFIIIFNMGYFSNSGQKFLDGF